MADLLTVREVAGVLRLTPQTVRDYIEAGRIRAHKLKTGGAGAFQWRVDRSDLDRYLQSCRDNGGNK